MRSPPEDEEFRRALAGVEPLSAPRRASLRRAPPAPLPHQTRRDERAALAESLAGQVSPDDALESGEELVYLREGLARQVLRKLRRGHWIVEESLDLHGMNRGGSRAERRGVSAPLRIAPSALRAHCAW